MSEEKKAEQRRKLSPEEREQMKRELKSQLRAYVDALKEQMLGAKEKDKAPDLDEAMQKAEKEAEKRLVAEAAQGDPMVEEAARVQARARVDRQPERPTQTPRSGHDGVIPKFSAWRPAGAVDEDEEAEEKAEPAMKTEENATALEKDVLNVASTPEKPSENAAGKEKDEKSGETTHGQVAAAKTAAEGEAAGGEVRPENGEQQFIVPEEEAAKSALPREELERMTRDIIAALKTIYDPEIPVDIYELGLIYRIDIADDRTVTIDMTLTAPGCPVAGDMPAWVQKAVSEVEGVNDVKVNLVFDPPWDMSRMSDEARLALNMF